MITSAYLHGKCDLSYVEHALHAMYFCWCALHAEIISACVHGMRALTHVGHDVHALHALKRFSSKSMLCLIRSACSVAISTQTPLAHITLAGSNMHPWPHSRPCYSCNWLCKFDKLLHKGCLHSHARWVRQSGTCSPVVCKTMK